MAADHEWNECVQWLVQCRILPEDHRCTKPGAQLFDLAQALRDGVLLCHLLNSLKPYCIDPKDFSLRPQLSQFLCLKNIRAFLQTCEKVFKVRSIDLFDPPDLFDVTNFRKVVHTLSKLSKTELAQRNGVSGFPTSNQSLPEHAYYNGLEELAHGFPPHSTGDTEVEEDIYGNLPDMASKHDLEDEEYDIVYQEGEEGIYDDICSAKRKPSESLPQPSTKRDHCIKEMVDTESNYVDALRMIQKNFIKPLKTILPTSDIETIFSRIEQLLEVHTGFYSELYRACMNDTANIAMVFVTWKMKFVLYGDYCCNLPHAQILLEEVTKKNEAVTNKIIECERVANEGRFRLRDLLHVPMQRVLKYHLLLKELIRNTDSSSDEQFNLQRALKAMQDLSLYVNEVKRDTEALQLIMEIQSSITDLQMPPNTSLRDYGRLQKDGELKVRSHEDNKVRCRYVFLFDKVMLMAKSKGETYSFKEAIVLAEYKVDSSSAPREQRRADKWNFSFQLVKADKSMAYTFLAKTDDMKSKWMEAINMAQDNTQPAAGRNFVMTTFQEAKVCDVCGMLLRGMFFQGYMCSISKRCVHKECIGKEKSETPNAAPPAVPERVRAYKAMVPYNGVNQRPGRDRRPLRFEKDDEIEVIEKESDWWKGRLGNVEGWFPQQYVTEIRRAGVSDEPPPYEQAQVTHPGQVQIGGVNSIYGATNSSQNNSLRVRRPHDPGYMRVSIGARPPPPQAHTFTTGTGYVNVIEDDLSSLEKYKWYVGKMSRDKAAELLRNKPNGSFLQRVSESQVRRGDPALSIQYGGSVRHIKIEKNKEGMYYMADAKFFHSLPELVAYYQENTLEESFPEVKTTLLHPYKTLVDNHNRPEPNGQTASQSQSEFTASGQRIMSHAIAQYDYASTAMNQISLKVGEMVAVLSKSGQDRGWWKGEHCDTHKVGYFPYAYVREMDD